MGLGGEVGSSANGDKDGQIEISTVDGFQDEKRSDHIDISKVE